MGQDMNGVGGDLTPTRPALSLRERQVLEQLIDGRTHKQIGRTLQISHRTVEKHRGRLKEKLGAKTLAELIRFGIDLGRPAVGLADPACNGGAPTLTRVLIAYVSRHGHVRRMAEAVADGARAASATSVDVRCITPSLVARSGTPRVAGDDRPCNGMEVIDLASYDVILFGTPNRYGNMSEDLRDFLERATTAGQGDSLVGRVGGAFCSASVEHGDSAAVLRSLHTLLLSLGMIPVGIPVWFLNSRQMKAQPPGTPYGAICNVGGASVRRPSLEELEVAFFQGQHAARVGQALHKVIPALRDPAGFDGSTIPS